MNPPTWTDTLGLILAQHPHLEDASRLDQSPAVAKLAALLTVSATHRGEHARATTTAGGELVVMLTAGVELTDSDVIVFPDAAAHLHAVRCDDTDHFEMPGFDHGDPAAVSAAIDDVFAALGG